MTEDIVTGLDFGADDYVVKPFSFEEVLARLRVIIKRSPQEHGTTYECADLLIDTDKKSVTRAGTDIELSPKEYAILEYMVKTSLFPAYRLNPMRGDLILRVNLTLSMCTFGISAKKLMMILM